MTRPSRDAELVPFWLVWNQKGRPPMERHPDAHSAKTEADRLAKAHPGQEFFVLTPVSSVVTDSLVRRRFLIEDDIPF